MSDTRRARDRRNHYLRKTGRGGLVDPTEMRARIRHWHYLGVTFERMSQRTGLESSLLRKQYRGGHFEQAQWRTEQAVLGAEFTEEDFEYPFAVGTRRRLQALVAKGFTQAFLAETSGWEHTYLNQFTNSRRVRTTPEVKARVLKLWDKLIDTDPLDVLAPRAVAYARTVARKRNYPPANCWDDDTIDDPEAAPQWTGACGTPEGRAIHRREGIPMCSACRSPRDESFSYGVFNPSAMLAWQGRRRLSRRELAEQVHLSPASVESYAQGLRVPPTSTLERLADALRCRPEDLCL